MKTIYLDNDFKCHTSEGEGMRAVETGVFDSKCDVFIEGHRLKPAGEVWVREDGKAFSGGETVSPWKPYAELDNAQREYERKRLADAENALAILLGGEAV